MNPEVQNIVAAGKLSAADGEKLSKLEPGTFCVHKSWGVGKIAEWDLLGDRLLIDFEGKPGHPLKLAFAINSLEILPADHLLSRRLADLDALKQMAADNAPALVELALKSSGNTLHLDDLEKLLKGRIIPDADYKKWWEGAKRALKTHRHIVVPAKRTEKLVLRDQAENAGTQMVKSFLAARDLKSKLATLASIQKDLDLFTDAKAELVPVFQDISDSARKSVKLNLKECLQLLLARDELIDTLGTTAPMGSMKISDLICETKDVLADAIKSLASSALGRIYRAFPEAFPNRAWVSEILHHLTKTGGRAVAEIAVVLDANDERDVLAEALKKSLRNRMLSSDLLIWMARERKGLAESVFDIDLGHAILGVIESDHMEGGPKRTGRLQDLLSDDKTLLGEMVAEADDEDVRLLAKRLINGSLFDELTRRSLMARIIKARPEMEQMMDDNSAAVKNDALIASWESLEKKKLELEDLVNVKIPENKREIQIARDEGDLRENGGYKAARDQQSVLLRMQAKLERELRHARGTDFANVSTDKVGIGTIVDLEDVPSGEKETFTILGAWDGDLEKNIISYLSESAKALIGKAVGDEVELPTDSHHVSRKAKVTAIRAFKV
ncbi:GreA/GreB family elongation factor [Prosthecobacter vanneervenii]|uniref:Transcription elongation GreA/GreB family factor n=1 Tax=Prosthecobacter vanneervenii TaxID=48466 RepID=A0A7W7Y8M3_9BACT|nr:GreA/GreB family elongation factor [Prosthecobacter vanneervenii]MBB5031658.1 transcription elongation GreA/GreB family factor [Prosthecobacter vanneervenii]